MSDRLASILASAVTDPALQEEYAAGRILEALRNEGLPEADVARLESLKAENLVEFLVLAVQVLEGHEPEGTNGEKEATKP